MPSEIWKFPLPADLIDPDVPIEVSIPAGAEPLTVGVDPGLARLALWAAVDPEAPVEVRRFLVVGTGWPLTASPFDVAARYVGTAVLGGYGVPLVFHVLDLGTAALDPGGPGPVAVGPAPEEADLDG